MNNMFITNINNSASCVTFTRTMALSVLTLEATVSPSGHEVNSEQLRCSKVCKVSSAQNLLSLGQ
jgi:hypothetical protein